jgi:uncharacterized protein (TIGR03000 family)
MIVAAGLGALLFPLDAYGQRGRRGFRGRGVAVGVGERGTRVVVGVGGWGGAPGWGWGWRGGWGGGGGYGSSYVYDDYDPYSSSGPSDYYRMYPPTDVYGVPLAEGPYGAGEGDQGNGRADNVAKVTVQMPGPNATIWFNGARMLARGSTLTYTTPPLDPGQYYHYKVKVRWMENGKPQELTRNLDVRAKTPVTLDFSRGQPADGQRQERGLKAPPPPGGTVPRQAQSPDD